jgi:fumarate hydratase class II
LNATAGASCRSRPRLCTAAYREGRPIIDVALDHTDLDRTRLETLLDPEKLTAGGI